MNVVQNKQATILEARMEIIINMDQKCSKCGAKGACENGLCLKCTADRAIATMRAVQGERRFTSHNKRKPTLKRSAMR